MKPCIARSLDAKPIRFLSLFSGIGGIDLGLERAGMECVAQVEIDPFCRRVLAKHWPDVPRFEDVRTITHEMLPDGIDLIAGGFPCTDISNAGKCAGITGEYSGLWREMLRCLRVVRRGVVENVAALLGRGMGEVLGDLAKIGNDAEWDCLPACDFGADIIRDRVFIYTFPNVERWPVVFCGKPRICREPHPSWGSSTSLDSPTARADRIESRLCQPAILRSLDGISSKLVQCFLKAYGNAVVPQIAEWIGLHVIEAMRAEVPA